MESVKTTAEKAASSRIITRSPESPYFEGLYFHSWEQVAQTLGIADFAAETVVSDLSQGAWKGHWIAHELLQQLELSTVTNVQPLLNEGNYADTVGTLIDNESEGDKNFTLALKNCLQITEALEKQEIRFVLILAPGKGYEWEEENLQLMQLFFNAIKPTHSKIILLCQQDAAVPAGWTVNFRNSVPETQPSTHFFPGIVSSETATRLSLDGRNSIRLRNGLYAPDPMLRKTPKHKETWVSLPHLHAAFQLNFSDNPDRTLIEGEATIRFAEGAYGIALRLLSGLLNKTANVLNRETIRSQMQNIRIALMDFESAAKETDPPAGLPDIYTASLSLSKAWGLVMTNQPLIAETYFEKARTFLKEEEFPRLYLYLLNISALNKLRSGQMEAAFELEKRIEQTLDSQTDRDWHITYVNNINQARLFKKAGDFTVAEQYYHRAFAINYQLKNESDLLYTNFCFAQLEELKGNPERAFIYWLRTCIHWLSNPAPEALAPRVAQAILFKKLSNRKGEVEDISEKLFAALSESCAQIGLLTGSQPESGPVLRFARPETTNAKPALAIGKTGWGMLLSPDATVSVYEGKAYDSLNRSVSDCLKTLLPTVSWTDYRTAITDTLFACELPQNSQELLLLSIRKGVNHLVFENNKFALTENDVIQLPDKIKAFVSPAIRFVSPLENNCMKVHFRRYHAPTELNERETWLLQYIQDHADQTLSSVAGFEELVLLAEKRVIQIYL